MLCVPLFDSNPILNFKASAILVMAHSLCNNTKQKKESYTSYKGYWETIRPVEFAAFF